MQLFDKKRISIIVETTFRNKVLQLLVESGASGYTIYDQISGKGEHGIRSGQGELKAMGNVEIVSITSEQVAEKVLRGAEELLTQGVVIIVHLADVSVIRDEHFA